MSLDESPSAIMPSPSPAGDTTGSNVPLQIDYWSPSNYPDLVFTFAPMLDDQGVISRFAVTIALDPLKSYPKTPPPGVHSQIFVETLITKENPAVPFSVASEIGNRPFLSGELRLDLVDNFYNLSIAALVYPGGAIPKQLLFTSFAGDDADEQEA